MITKPALSPMKSPSKVETSTWWQRTSTRAYSRLIRKPYQEEQEETTDHTGVKNYKTSRMHCQKPEKQLKSILQRRTTPHSNKPKPDFSGTRYRHAEEAVEKKTASLNFEKDGRKLWKLTKQFTDEGYSREKITLEENSKLLNGKQAAGKFSENHANESKIPVSASKQREARRAMREKTAKRTTVKPMQQPLRLGELQATYLSSEIEDTFQKQKLVLVSWIDLQKAFDKVWKEGLLVKLPRNGIAINMFHWIKSYLYNRRASVSLDRVHSKNKNKKQQQQNTHTQKQ